MWQRNLLFSKHIVPGKINTQHGLCVSSESGVFMAKMPAKLDDKIEEITAWNLPADATGCNGVLA